ncbi:hypothetical protein HDE_14479 [Halotydeus destructor]|nr:hypothetical protein HDE_14479 [Halotydeus destructor]
MRHLCSACRADNQPDKPEMDNLGTDCSGPAWSIRSANKCSKIFTNIVNTLAPLLSDETVIELTTLVTMMAGNNFTQYGLYGQEKRTGIDPMYGVVVG